MFFESFLLNLGVIVVLLVALIFDYVTKFFSYFYIRHIPYKWPIPFFGSDLFRVLNIRSTTDEVNNLYAKHPTEPFVGYIKSRIPDLIVKDPKFINVMLEKESAHFSNRGLCLDKSQDVCLRNNLFYAEGEKWHLLRGNLESILKSFSEKFQQNELSIVKYLQEVNGEVSVQIFLEKTMDCIFKQLLFEEVSPREELIYNQLRPDFQKRSPVARFKSYLKVMFPSIYNRCGLTTLQVNSEQVNQLSWNTELIQHSKKMKALCPETNEKALKNSEIDHTVALFSSFIYEGYVPCLNILTCLMYELARNPEIQQKLKSSSTDEYLNRVIKETMRMYPQYSILNRKCTKTFKFKDTGLLFDRGVTVTVPVDAIHKDSKYFPIPEVFNPERFSENCDTSECVYLPYGVGHRRCVGEELSQLIIKAVIRSVLTKYKLDTCTRTPAQLRYVDHNFSRYLVDDVHLIFTPV